MPDNHVILVGGGGHCRSCIDVIENLGGWKIAGIVDGPLAARMDSVLGYKILGDDSMLPALRQKYAYALVTIGQTGSSKVRRQVFANLKIHGFVLPVFISPLAHVSRHAVIDEGTIVMHRALVNAGAKVGKNCILNTGCLVEHDTVVGDHCHVSTSAAVNGMVRIGPGSFVGSNATIVHGVELDNAFFCKAGQLVKKLSDVTPIKE